MSAPPEAKWTPERYLAFERESEIRHEFLNGEIVALAGASVKHNLIAANILANLHRQLRQRECRVFPSDMRLKVSRTGLYTYPDLSVVCGTPQLEDDEKDTLLNPSVIVEVLSPSTESYDRGKKFQHYRAIETLQEYLLIAQDSHHIEHYAKQNSGMWIFSDADGLDASIQLSSIECNLDLADVYVKVTLGD